MNCANTSVRDSFDGSMSQSKREAVIARFSEPLPVKKRKKKSNVIEPDVGAKGKKKKDEKKAPLEVPSVMLISLKAGALGLNLTVASQVFLMDPWWQASIEAQGMHWFSPLFQSRVIDLNFVHIKFSHRSSSSNWTNEKVSPCRSRYIEARLKFFMNFLQCSSIPIDC